MMRKFTAFMIFVVLLIGFPGVALSQQVDKKTEQALIAAINDEYKARALYQKVLEKFGSVRPFSNIIKAETNHIEQLKPLFIKYGIEIPEDNWINKVPTYATLQEACEAGVEAEIENVKMYDEFFAFVKEEDIIEVFKRLRAASQENHLPAFQRCSEGGAGQGRGKMRNN